MPGKSQCGILYWHFKQDVAAGLTSTIILKYLWSWMIFWARAIMTHNSICVSLMVKPWYCNTSGICQGGLARCDSWGRKESDTTERLIWSDTFWGFLCGSPCGSDSKASAYNAGDLGSISGLGSSPGEGNGNPLQYYCLENPMEGGAQ